MPPTYHVEGLDPTIAADLGLPPGIPFVVGANDGVLSNLGVDAIQPGDVAITIGTSGAMRAVVDRPLTDPAGRTFCYLLTEKHWVVGGPVNNGGIAFRWVRDELAAAETETAKRLGIDPYDVLTRIAERVPPGSEGLIFHPYLTGERAPWWNASMRASFFGLAACHHKEHMVRAVLEGVIYSLFSILPAVEDLIGTTRTMKATGGFARSGLWRQMMADVFDREVVVPESFESSCLGAAILALYALGDVDSIEVVATHGRGDPPASADPRKRRGLRRADAHLPEHRRQADRRVRADRRIPAGHQRRYAPNEACGSLERQRADQRRLPMAIHPTLEAVTRRIRERSAETRADLPRAAGAGARTRARCADTSPAPTSRMPSPPSRRPRSASSARGSCRTSASSPPTTTCCRRTSRWSASLRSSNRRRCEAGGVAQFAGGVPAMCDGVTQGEPGMELSLFSRDVIAMATAVSLSHNTFDAALCLGICDKIVPGLLDRRADVRPSADDPGAGRADAVGAAQPGQGEGSPALSRKARSAARRCWRPSSMAYHAPGTCTFYGTANSNQMLMEVMGLHLPGAAFVNPNTPLRDALTDAAARRVLQITALGDAYTPVGRVVDERAIANGIVGLLATGGSTNHTIHLVAIARAAGILITWDDFASCRPTCRCWPRSIRTARPT